MNLLPVLAFVILLNPFLLEAITYKTTADRIASHGYPVETHIIQTSDGYILQLFRIPFSPHLRNKHNNRKPVVLLQHGILSSSDCWVLNGPEDALAFLLADSGYDVWLSNSRGNVYSKQHATMTSLLPHFWDFSWHEIGVYDLPAIIDYALYMTDQKALHYVGHSQGTTAFLVLLSQLPRYNRKIKTSHLLAPVGFMDNMQSEICRVLGPFLGNPSILSSLIGSHEFLPNNKLFGLLGSHACSERSAFQSICGNILFLIAGWDSQHLNFTLLPDVLLTHPAGASSSQMIHYLQEQQSTHFRSFDFGVSKNKKYYKQRHPPDYFVENISPEFPVQFYFSDNDKFAAVEDVIRMYGKLGANVELYHIDYTDWNHLDFLWAMEVREEIYDRVIELANDYEAISLESN